MASENQRVEIELKIMKYQTFLRQITLDAETELRIKELIAELENELRSIDE